MARSIFDHPCVKRVSCWILLKDGAMTGRIIVAYPNDGAGTVRAMVGAWSGPLAEFDAMHGQAGGYGYDKTSAAVCDALTRAKVPDVPAFDGRGRNAMEDYFRSIGYQIESVM